MAAMKPSNISWRYAVNDVLNPDTWGSFRGHGHTAHTVNPAEHRLGRDGGLAGEPVVSA